LLVIGTASARAHASPPATDAVLSIDGCDDVDAQEVNRLFNLSVDRPAKHDPPPTGAVQVSIECAGTEVIMQAWDSVSGQRTARTLHLSETARMARPRLLAVTAVELAATVLAEAQARSAAAVGAVPSPPPPAAAPPLNVTVELPEKSAQRVVAFAGALWFPSLGSLATGGLRVGFDGSGIWSASVDAQASFGDRSTADADVTIALLSVNPLVGLHHTLGGTTFRAETGPRLGIGRLSGTPPATSPDLATTFTAPWLAWSQHVSVEAAITRHLVVELTVEGGYVLAPLAGKVREQREVVVEGLWLGAFLSFGVRN
jgi:hypothetical protein